MRTIKLFFCLLIMWSVSAEAQKTDISKDVETYIDSNGSMKQYAYAYDQLLTMLASQYPESTATAEGWKYLQGNKEKALAEMKKELIPIYQENFNEDEIKGMTAFYQSEAGQQLMNDRSKMTEAHKEVFNAFYTSEMGKKIIEKQPILTQAISAVSESWSRDLYETAVSILK